MGKWNPENTFCETRKGKVLPWVGNTVYVCCGGKSFSIFGWLIFISWFSAAPSKMKTSGKCVCVIANQWGNTFRKLWFPLFSLALLLDMTLTGRCCPASVIMAGLARPGGRHTAGSGVRPQRVEWKNDHLFLEKWSFKSGNDHLQIAFSWKMSGKMIICIWGNDH